jgi:hypothetical protein
MPSLNVPKWDSTWATSPRSSIGCVQNDFYVWRKPCTYLALTLTPSLNGSKWDLTRPRSHRSSIGGVQNDLSLWYVRHKQCTNFASRLALSPNGSKWASTWAPSPRSPLGACKTISEPMVRLAQTMHLSCSNTNTVSKRTKRDITWWGHHWLEYDHINHF